MMFYQAYINMNWRETKRESLGGSPKDSFIAVPSLISKECSNTDYVGLGDSAEEALNDCLKRIKGISLSQVIPQG